MKSSLIFAKSVGIVLSFLLCFNGTLVSARNGLGAQLPGAQQQRAVDAERQRQNKQRQLDTMKQKQQSKGCREPDESSLVTVPDTMTTYPQGADESGVEDCEPEGSSRKDPKK